jgi:predicted HicB family RNase H-like nuclease
VKRIIDGKTYNIHTATEVTGGGHPHSLAWWGLYQTRHGAFFKVVIDHDGETVLEFRPLTDPEAQTQLERHANHLVEQYFGAMPEGGAAERRLTIRIPGNLANRLEAAAKSKGISLNSYAMRCFEKCTAADGQPAGRG